MSRYPSKLCIGGKEVDFSTSMGYMGVVMDEKLNRKTHLDQVLKKYKASLIHISNKHHQKMVGPKTVTIKMAPYGYYQT